MAIAKEVKKAAQIKVAVAKKKAATKKSPAKIPVKVTVKRKAIALAGKLPVPAKKIPVSQKRPPEQAESTNPLYATSRKSTAFQLSWHRYAFSLKAGAWRQHVAEKEFKTLMAEALNACACYRREDEREKYSGDLLFLYRCLDQLHVAGYYITEDTLYLVWDIADIDFTTHNHYLPDQVVPPEKMDDRFLFMLHRFYNAVRKILKSHIHYPKIADMEIETHSDKQHVAPYDADLFTKRKMADEHLAMLLTGHTVNLPYHDLHLERLKARLHQAEFCSVIDYQGGIGPVVVRKEEL